MNKARKGPLRGHSQRAPKARTTNPQLIHPTAEYTLSRVPAVYDPPLASLDDLLASDASPREIRRRLRLNLAIRLLLEAIADMESEAAI